MSKKVSHTLQFANGSTVEMVFSKHADSAIDEAIKGLECGVAFDTLFATHDHDGLPATFRNAKGERITNPGQERAQNAQNAKPDK
jgi:hypothetical protein